MNYNNNISIYPLLLCYLFFTACATPVPPTGGAKDTTPPEVVTEKSDASMQTNFKKRSFELTFNEWVQLSNVTQQVVVTPPLAQKPEIKLKKKTVTFTFDEKEELREDATYVINFGDAVKDFREGLPAENLRFVFSTGDYIDSLFIEGTVKDAFSGDPVADVVVMLYDNLTDSVVYKERPFYIGRTSKSGTFKIENIRSDTFKIFALLDKNFNYLFDAPSEKIGFKEEPFVLNDSIKVKLNLELFEEEKKLRVIGRGTDRYGKATLAFNKAVSIDIQISTDSVLQRQHIAYEKDSIHIWYHPKDSIDWSIYIQQDTLFYDTVKVRAGSYTEFLAKAKLRPTKSTEKKLLNHNRTKPIQLFFNHPIAKIDSSAFVLLEDSLETSVPVLLTLSVDTPQMVKLNYKWKENMSYKLQLTPGAVTDWYGLKNDSTSFAFTVPTLEAFGNMIVKFTGLKPKVDYIVQLYKGKELLNESNISADSTYSKSYNGLPAAVSPAPIYELQIIEDRDGNGRWSPGSYSLKTQSEKLYFRKLGELRGNWDINYEVSLEEGKTVTTPSDVNKEPELSKDKE